MALSGVRSSWLILARNCDLCWLASSSWRLLSSISWNNRAFWMASADCAAKVLMRSTVFFANSPGVRRRTTSMPTILSPRSSGATINAVAAAQDDVVHGRGGCLLQVGDLSRLALREG